MFPQNNRSMNYKLYKYVYLKPKKLLINAGNVPSFKVIDIEDPTGSFMLS